ncbi:MAG: metalloregulator ArsR/SmtB family transcription factor, partial [Isosphaeraceae bacterium]
MARKTSQKPGAGGASASEGMPEVSEQTVRELAQVFKLLSDETRLRILFYLAQNSELHVTDLCTRLGQSQPAVSHHLA